MSDYLGRLVQRAIAPQTLLQPRVPSLFEPSAPLEEIVTERPAARTSRTQLEATTQQPTFFKDDEPRLADAEPPNESTVRTIVRETPPAIETRERIVERYVPTERTVVERVAGMPAPASTRNVELSIATDGPVVERQTVATAKAHAVHVAARPAARDVPVPARAEPERTSSERDVHVTIGRIDVRAITQQAPRERVAARRPPTLTLDEYLAKRSGR